MPLRPAAPVRLLFLLLLIVAASCGDSTSPEERRADAMFAAAREAWQQGRLRRSHQMLDSALAAETGLRRAARIGEIHRLRGQLLASVGAFDSAFAAHRAAAEAFRSATDRSAVRTAAIDVAELELTMGLDRRAYARLEEALRLSGVFGEEAGARAIRWAMLPAARAIEDFGADSLLRASLAGALDDGADIRGRGLLLQEEGRSLMRRERWDAAVEAFRRSAEHSDRAGDSVAALRSLTLAARAAVGAGRTTEALQLYSVGLRRADATRGARRIREEMLVRVGNLYLTGGQPAEAVRFYRAALNSAIRRRNRLGEGLMFAQLGYCALAGAGDQSEAAKNLDASADIFNDVRYPAGRAYALLGSAMTAERMGRFTQALEAYAAAMLEREACLREPDPDDLMQECEVAALGSAPDAFASRHLDLLARMGRFEEAFSWAERGRARELGMKIWRMELRERDSSLTAALQLLAGRRAVRAGTERALADALEAGPAGAERVEPLLRNMQQAFEAMAAAAREVASRSAVYGPLAIPRPISVQEVQRTLPRGSALVTYLPGTQAVHAFTISATGASGRASSGTTRALRSLAAEYVSLLQNRDRYRDSLNSIQRAQDRRIDDLTERLYAMLIRPVEQEIDGSPTVTFVPPTSLRGFPFHALRRSAGRRGSPYLIEEHAVTYLPAAFMFSAAQPAPPAAGADILALGCAGESGWDVEYELRDIRAFFKDVRLRFGVAATFDTLLRARADVVHLALPFVPSNVTPANASAAFSDGKALDTWKPVPWERFALLPPFPTVIVSDLGAGGATVRPEFPLLLLANGTPTVVVQSYPPSRKTKKFFGEIFYTATLSGLAPRAAARQTQLEMLRTPEYAAPSIWAPFMVWGK